MTEARYHKAPWQLSVYHNGTVSRSFHVSFEEAKKAKGKTDRLKAKEGSKALSYDRAAHLEYDAAKRLLRPGIMLADALRQVYQESPKERKTVADAVEVMLAAKGKQGLASTSIKELRCRLRRFAQAFPQRGLETITRNEIVDWLVGLDRAPRTLWNFYATLGGFFSFAERRDWVDKNPMRKIDPGADLPKVRKSIVQILTLPQGEAVMRYIEQHAPHIIGWMAVQYFVGIRDAEAERLRGEWIDAKEKTITLPGWHLDNDVVEGVTKTRDDWVIDRVPEAFWLWVARYPTAFAKGKLVSPSNRAWSILRDQMIAEGIFKKWPLNGLRHSFATYHLSAHRDQSATSLVLRHQNAARLWANYLSKLVPVPAGLSYLALAPLPAD